VTCPEIRLHNRLCKLERYSRIKSGKWQSQDSEELHRFVLDEYLIGNISIRDFDKIVNLVTESTSNENQVTLG
jgi:hypothetical protein